MGGKITKQNKSNAQIVQSKQIKRSSNFKINNSLSPLKKQNSESPKIKVSTSVAILGTKSPFTLVPMQRQKKTKLVITARPLGEINVLQVINKNNYELNDQDLINECLLKHFFMRTLDKEARHEIIKEMTLCKVDKDEVLFKQGSLGSYFYIVRSGEFNLFINDKLANTMHRGDSFGELALLHGAPRSGTVIAGDESLVYCLERRNFRKIVDHINSLNFEENRKFINMIPILSNLESDFKSLLANQLMKQFYEPGSSIIKEGELASCLYIVKEGEVDCVHKGVLVRTLKKGEHFGEKSILLDCPRTLDVIAKTSVVVYSVSVETLTTMVGEKYKDVLLLSFIKIAFTQSRMFSKINLRLVENAYDGFTMSHFRKGDLVIKFGYTLSSRIIVIIEGNIIDSNEKIVGKRGDILFEDYVSSLSKERTTLDLFAYPDLLIMETNTAEFIKILGGNFSFKELLRKSSGLEFLYKIPLLKTLPQKKIEMLSNVVNYTKYEDGKKIIKQGDVDDKFYIIKSGMVKIFIDDEYVRTLTTFGYFGERAIFFNEPRSATVISSGTVELYEITSNDFKHILEDSLASYLKNRFFLHDMGFQLKDFDYLGPLGHGNFGIVALVKNRKNDCEYALKFVCKKQIDHETLHTNLEQERAVLLKIDHPFIVKLVKSMKCDKYIYFLMEYIKGKELFEVIRDIGLLNKSQTMFYGASLMITIDYLHEKKCVYRDLKPENVMIGENGFIKLIDFGTIKEITDRTTTVIGTPHYMAPEIILGDGYSFSVDWWSLSICLYEFMCGCVPFGDTAEEPMEVYKAIVNADFSFPTFIKDKDFQSLMKKMLVKSPLNRLCKLSLIKSDPWFKDFSWENLLLFNMNPPYFPKIEKLLSKDTLSSFCDYLKTTREYVPTKNLIIEKNLQVEYDNWYKKF